MRRYVFRLALLPLVLLAPRTAAAGEIEVEITGHTLDEGVVLVGAYRSQEDFDAGRTTSGAFVEDPSTEVLRLTLRDVPAGPVAIAVFQDRDGDRKISKNFLGIPTERYGFSRNARGTLGPPDFEAMHVVVGAEPRTERIRLD